MAHKHPIYDTDKHFVIDPITRNFIVQTDAKLVLMQFDHNSERFTFEIPRYIEEHDMSLCNRVQVHYINTGPGGSYNDVYEVTDLQISPEDENAVICSWLISQNSTGIAGSLNFVLHYACVTDTVIDYAWHSNIFSQVKVLNGISNQECVVEQNADILEQWRQELINAGILAASEAVNNVNMAIKRINGSVTLLASDWKDNTQSKPILGLDADNDNGIFFSPATKADQTAASNAGIFTQVEGTVATFTVDEAPTTDITLTYLIIGFEPIIGSIETYDGSVTIE